MTDRAVRRKLENGVGNVGNVGGGGRTLRRYVEIEGGFVGCGEEMEDRAGGEGKKGGVGDKKGERG